MGTLAAQSDSFPRHWGHPNHHADRAEIRSPDPGPADLLGKKVATVAGTTSATYLHTIGVDASEKATIDDCYRALREDGTYDQIKQKWSGNDQSSTSGTPN